MHQTFYISGDEEISSIVDRLRKSVSQENYFVVPPRALVFQSVVNLKLLAKEAEKIGRKAILVTQDEMGASLAQRAGLNVRSSMEGIGNNQPKIKDFSTKEEISSKKMEFGGDTLASGNEIGEVLEKKQRLSSIGSADFYGEQKATSQNVKIETTAAPASLQGKRDVIYVGKQGLAGDIKSNRQTVPTSSIVPKVVASNESARRPYPGTEQRIEKMFLNKEHPKVEKPKISHSESVPVGGRTKMFIGIFLLLGLFVLGAVAIFVILPSAKIKVVVNDERQKADIAIAGSEQIVSADESTKNIPVKFIEKDEVVTLSYEATGIASGSGSKAKGAVIINNEYSDQPQTLIATTRLKNSEGKIYRITKDVTVPGMRSVGSDKEPGKVEVEVVADDFGEEFDMSEGKFTIPGFEGGPKYEKFSAEVKEKISGGNMSDNPIKAVSEQDIIKAKKETETALKNKVKDIINADLEEGYAVMDETMDSIIVQSSASVKAGAEKDSFDYAVKAHIKALAFSAEDAKKILVSSFEKTTIEKASANEMKIEYTGISPDFTGKKLSLRAHGEIVKPSDFDAETFKKDILGKNEQEIGKVVDKFENIDNVEMEFNFKFVSRVPNYPQRVSVEVIHQEKSLAK